MLAQKSYQEALRCYEGYSETYYNEKEIFPIPDVDSLKVDSIISLKIKGKNAEIRYRVSFISKRQGIKKTYISGDRLVFTASGWKIGDVIIPQ